MAVSDRGSIGRQGEQQALRYLERAGLTLVQSNFRTRFGEIDLIMRDGDCLVFVEVRFRRDRDFATAAESVDGRKRRKLALAAAGFARSNRLWRNCAMRFDVVALDCDRDGRVRLDWITDAFRPGE